MPKSTASLLFLLAGAIVGGADLVIWSADGWADWVVFGVIVVTVYGFAVAVSPRMFDKRKRSISRTSDSQPRR